MKITIVAGARPNFMKIAPIIRSINNARTQGKDINYRLIYTGKEDDPAIETSLFTDLNIKEPDAFLGIEEKDGIQLAAKIMMAFDKELSQHPTNIVMVVDDFTPTMSCAIVAKKRNIKVAHQVAGIRSFDMDMPKEVNRMITDGLSDYLFTAGMIANRNLNQTGTENENVYYVGNILIDNLRYNRHRFTRPIWMDTQDIIDNNYILLTLNRHILLKDTKKLRALLETIIEQANGMPIIAPVHAYVREAIRNTGISSDLLHILPSQRYLGFGYLISKAKAIITDSGNVAEEATFLNIPCITLNSYAEHPETVQLGTNVLVGEDEDKLKGALQKLHNGTWKQTTLPERWDGRTADRIVQILLQK